MSTDVPSPPLLKVRCPACGRSQRVAAQEIGLTHLCPACGRPFAAALPGTALPPVVVGPVLGTVEPGPWRSVQWVPVGVGLGIVMLTLAGAGIALVWLWAAPSPVAGVRRPPSTAVVRRPLPATVPATRPDRPASSEPAPVPSPPLPTTLAATPPPALVVPPPPLLTPPPPPWVTPVRPPRSPPDLDARIGLAINAGVDYLLGELANGKLPSATTGDGVPAGADALVVYAVLQAAQAIDRPDLNVDAPATGRMLDALRAMPMAQRHTTYDRSLRAAALAVYARSADKRVLRDDAAFLEAESRDGAYTYDPVVRRPTRSRRSPVPADLFGGRWDNSNSQYGALGVWCALDAGTEVPLAFWEAVRRHWAGVQLPDGQWGYSDRRSDGRLSMTVAGIATLLVAEDQLGLQASVGPGGRSPYTPPVTRGLAWLEAGDHAVDVPLAWQTYALYGIERVGLASGYKTFGRHDWYRELAADVLRHQRADGSFQDGAEPLVDTAYTLLFLSRGRHPILMDKLRFDGAWANRANDLAHLARFASKELERPLNWQVVSADDDWFTWLDAPVLYLASHAPPRLTDEQLDKLRQYARAGGLIFITNDGSSPAFDAYVTHLAQALFPAYPLHNLPATDPVYRSLFPLKPPPPLKGVTNGSRPLLLYSRDDLGRSWQLRDTVNHGGPFQLGLNVFIDAAGKGPFRNKLRSPYLPEPDVRPVGRVTVARVTYAGGDADPEPAALPRFARAVLGETSVGVNVISADATALDPATTPVAFLTGTGPVRLAPPQLAGLHRYVAAGGVLLADACGGSTTTRVDLAALIDHAFPGERLTPLAADDPVLAGTGPCMSPVGPKLRPFAADAMGNKRLPFRGLTAGRGRVVLADVDVTTGLLGTGTWGVMGYDPDVAYGLARNALLWAVERPRQGATP